MRSETAHGFLRVYLSRRNLLALLVKLDGAPEDSACTIVSPDTCDPMFSITAEEDDVHYAHESRAELAGIAGTMHPDTEAAMRHLRVD